MRIYSCPSCGAKLPFESLSCYCGTQIAYDLESDCMVALSTACANRQQIACNWASGGEGELCGSCVMTEVIPDTFHGDNRDLWAASERAKRWVLANLARWGWFRAADTGARPVFHLLSEDTRRGFVPVTMGHADGVVTINASEADEAERTQRRSALGERLRTMIGHYRHELGHFFFFHRFAPQYGFTDRFRVVFGDETADYDAALAAHYQYGPPSDWNARCVSPYGSSHPHEDWAESFAHLLHLTDLADSFAAAGLTAKELPEPGYDAYAESDAERLITTGAGLGIALNHVNRSMGLQDIYPFVLTPVTREKLSFVHRWCRGMGPAQQP